MTARVAGNREDTFLVTVSLIDAVTNHNHDLGIWDMLTGGGLDSDDVTYYPGGLGAAITLGGRQKPDAVTVERLYDTNDDHAKIQTLYNNTGKGILMVAMAPIDDNGNVFSQAITWSGKLKKVTQAQVNSEGNAAAKITLEMTVQNAPALI